MREPSSQGGEEGAGPRSGRIRPARKAGVGKKKGKKSPPAGSGNPGEQAIALAYLPTNCRREGLYEALRELIFRICILRRSVQRQMEDLSKEYKRTMRTLLQLYAWAFPKGSPPRALYWVRLEPKRSPVDDKLLRVIEKLRPRWHTRLKIRNRSQLSSQIHWNGMDEQRPRILAFYEKAGCLNEAHRILSQRPSHLVRTFRRKQGGLVETNPRTNPPLQDVSSGLLNGAGPRLLGCAWEIQSVLKEESSEFCILTGRGPEFAMTLEVLQDPEGNFNGFLWQEPGREQGCRSLSELLPYGLMKDVQGNPFQEQSALRLRRLMETVDHRLELLRVVFARLREIGDLGEAALMRYRAIPLPPASAVYPALNEYRF